MGRTNNKRARPAGGECVGKIRHHSFKAAKKSIANQPDRTLHPYQCDMCRGVHLSSRSRA